MATVLVRGIEFYGFHGVSEAECEVGHRFIADVEVEAEVAATKTDRVEDTVDYGSIAQVVIEVGTGASCKTVERLASVMIDRILAVHRNAQAVTIELEKQLPPMPVTVASAGVRLSRARKGS